MLLPQPDPARLAKREAAINALLAVLPAECVLHTEEALTPYECDGVSAYRQKPMAVVQPRSTEEVSRAIAWSGLVANLPFINDSFPARPGLHAQVQQAFANVPLAHLHFRKDDSYWEAIDAAGY